MRKSRDIHDVEYFNNSLASPFVVVGKSMKNRPSKARKTDLRKHENARTLKPAKQRGCVHSAVVEAIADITVTILHEDNNKIGANASYDKLRAIFHHT